MVVSRTKMFLANHELLARNFNIVTIEFDAFSLFSHKLITTKNDISSLIDKFSDELFPLQTNHFREKFLSSSLINLAGFA